MKKWTTYLLVAVMCLWTGCALAVYTPGTYTGTAQGMGGAVNVIVTFTEDVIEKIEMGEENETTGICETAFETLPGEIVAHQSLLVDSVSGSTITSAAIKNAVADAVKQAGGDVNALRVAVGSNEVKDEEFSYDVVVVGGGLAGLTAAVQVKESGLSVALVEKLGFTGGTSAVSAGAVFVLPDDEDATVNALADYWIDGGYIIESTPEYPNRERFLEVARKCDDITAMLERAGLGYSLYEMPNITWLFPNALERAVGNMEHAVAKSVPGAYASPKGGSALTKSLNDYAVSLGVDIYLNTPATKLTAKEGKVTGVVCETKNGVKTFSAGAVILATGDCMNDKEYAKAYNNEAYLNYTASSIGCTGDGEKMAMEVGAVLYENQYFMGGNLIFNPYDMVMAQAGANWPTEALLLDRYGERKCAETTQGHSLSYYFVSDEYPGSAWVIMEEDSAKKIPELESYLAMTSENSVVKMYKADTIEELAAMTDLDPQTMIDAVAAYNALCDAGEDTQYGKAAELMQAIDEGPFYAGLTYDMARGTIGGIVTNEKMEVTNAEGEAIEGLYAAGAVSNGVYYHNYYPGGSLAITAACGIMAAENAAAFIGK